MTDSFKICLPKGSIYSGKLMGKQVEMPQKDLLLDISPIGEIPELKILLQELPEMVKEIVKTELGYAEEQRREKVGQNIAQALRRRSDD